MQADLKTFTALGVYGLNAVTCVVSETPGKVSRIEPVSREMVRDQIRVVARSFPIAAIKTGLLCSGEIVQTVGRAIADFVRRQKDSPSRARIPLVIDPVIIATSGDQLLEADAVELYEKELFPLATLITPNLDEAAKLIGEKSVDRRAVERVARALSKRYGTSILLKGGHLLGDQAIDFLVLEGKVTKFAAPFVRGVATHGTGCTYSAAITAGLASGLSLMDAISRAKKFVSTSIAQHLCWRSKSGKDLEVLNHYPNESRV